MTRKFLFVDDFEIETMRGVTRRDCFPEKHPPVLVPDKPWEDKRGCSCPMVCADPESGKLKMWYWNQKGGLADLYAESVNGTDWEKPILNLVEIDGSNANNKVSTPGRIGPGSVYKCSESVDSEGADKLYRTVSWIPNEKWSQRYLPIFSADGFTWRTCANPDEEPGISGEGVGDTGTFTVADDELPRRKENIPGRYIAFPRLHVKVGRWGRRAVGMTYADSTHRRNRIMLDWPRPALVLAPDLLDDEMCRERLDRAFADGIIHFNDADDQHCEFYTMQAWAEGNVFFGAVYIFDVSMNMERYGMWNQHGIMETQLVYSRDLVHWERLHERKPWIGRGEPGSQDAAMVHYASIPIRSGDTMYQYYSSGNYPHPSVDQKWATEQLQLIAQKRRGPFQAVGLVTFRPDGYVGLEARSNGGVVTTKPVLMSDERLVCNVDASGGRVSVSVLDENGRAISGYKKSADIASDEIECEVGFPEPLSRLSGRKVRLRFALENASLYSYTLSP